ncbi:hypothetical protein GGF32_006626 [Allomyces javanicus]|nr:hypothetical protein GGF32_006626 [Allomyces javanicus]
MQQPPPPASGSAANGTADPSLHAAGLSRVVEVPEHVSTVTFSVGDDPPKSAAAAASSPQVLTKELRAGLEPAPAAASATPSSTPHPPDKASPPSEKPAKTSSGTKSRPPSNPGSAASSPARTRKIPGAMGSGAPAGMMVSAMAVAGKAKKAADGPAPTAPKSTTSSPSSSSAGTTTTRLTKPVASKSASPSSSATPSRKPSATSGRTTTPTESRPATAPAHAARPKKPTTSSTSSSSTTKAAGSGHRAVKSAPTKRTTAAATAGSSSHGSPPRSPGPDRTRSPSSSGSGTKGSLTPKPPSRSDSSGPGGTNGAPTAGTKSAIEMIKLSRPPPTNSCCIMLQKHLLNDVNAELTVILEDKAALAAKLAAANHETAHLLETKLELTQKNHELDQKLRLMAQTNAQLQADLVAARGAVTSGNDTVEALQKKLADEHKINAQLVFFNRSLKTQVCELEEAKEEAAKQLALARMELDRHRPKTRPANGTGGGGMADHRA